MRLGGTMIGITLTLGLGGATGNHAVLPPIHGASISVRRKWGGAASCFVLCEMVAGLFPPLFHFIQEVLLVDEQSPRVRTIVPFALVLVFAVKTIFSDTLVMIKHGLLVRSAGLIALDFWLDPVILDFPNVLYRLRITVPIKPVVMGK